MKFFFYVRQFDIPLKYGVPLPLRRQMDVSVDGTRQILDLLTGLGVNAVFYVNDEFSKYAAGLVARMKSDGHTVVEHEDAPPAQNYWGSLHNMPLALFFMQKHECLTFQAWEFSDVVYNNELRLPFYMRRNSGLKMVRRLAMVVDKLQNKK